MYLSTTTTTRINLHLKLYLAGKYFYYYSIHIVCTALILRKKKTLFRNYLEEVGKHIDFESSSTKVLDIGCGAGGWVMVCVLFFLLALVHL